MREEQVITWIFLAVALASNTEPTDWRGISMVADGINHAVPTHKELQISILWLTDHGLVTKQGKKYTLTEEGRLMYKQASVNTNNLFAIWERLDYLTKGYK